MACSQYQKNRQRSLEKPRQLRDQKVQRLTKGYEAGDQRSCMELQNLLQSEQFRAENQFKPELHRRA